MKKVKIMLMSIAVLAVVGGALAFKAKFNEPICYTFATTTEPGGPLTCPEENPLTCDLITHGTFGLAGQDFICTTEIEWCELEGGTTCTFETFRVND